MGISSSGSIVALTLLLAADVGEPPCREDGPGRISCRREAFERLREELLTAEVDLVGCRARLDLEFARPVAPTPSRDWLPAALGATAAAGGLGGAWALAEGRTGLGLGLLASGLVAGALGVLLW